MPDTNDADRVEEAELVESAAHLVRDFGGSSTAQLLARNLARCIAAELRGRTPALDAVALVEAPALPVEAVPVEASTEPSRGTRKGRGERMTCRTCGTLDSAPKLGRYAGKCGTCRTAPQLADTLHTRAVEVAQAA